MFKNFVILKNIFHLIVPYVIIYSFYIQLNGEISPGGGFQAGVIFASGVIMFDLTSNKNKLEKILNTNYLLVNAITGVMIYLLVGFVSIFYGHNYLNYSILVDNAVKCQVIGIFMVEIGVGLTVTSVMCLIYANFRS